MSSDIELNASCLSNKSSLAYYACPLVNADHVFALALTGILVLFVAISFLILSQLPVIVSKIKYKRQRRRFIRHTNTRSSRSSSHGGAYFVRTQDQQSMQLPIYQNRFEYVDMLTETQTPTTVHTLSEENLVETTTSTLERGHEEHNTSVDPPLVLYDAPDSVQTHVMERSISEQSGPQTTVSAQGRSRSKSVHQFTRSLSQRGQTAVHMQRGSAARESTRSMPGGALNSTRQQRQRTHTVNISASFQGSAQRRERVRSMFDPLPDVPPTTNPILNALDSVDSVVDSEIVIIASPTNTNHELTIIPPIDHRISRLASEKQFSFEDGTLIRNDVPPFCDPEFCGDEIELDNPQISIYSSQILEAETHATTNVKEAINSTAADEQLYDRLDHSLPTQPPPPAPPDSKRSQPEGAYSQVNITSDIPRKILISGRLEEATEALYDIPIVVVTKTLNRDVELSLKDIVDPKHLFDDPGYTEGMMATKLTQKPSDKHSYQNFTSIGESDGGRNVSIPELLLSGDDEESVSVEKIVSLQPLQEGALAVSTSSLSVQLDYDEEEFDNLDPDIASCLTKDRITFV